MLRSALSIQEKTVDNLLSKGTKPGEKNGRPGLPLGGWGLAQPGQLLLQAGEGGAEVGQAFLFLFDDGGGGFGDEGLVGELGAGFGDFGFDAGHFLAQPGAFGGQVDFNLTDRKSVV